MALIVVSSVSNIAFRICGVQNSSLSQSTGHDSFASSNRDPSQVVIRGKPVTQRTHNLGKLKFWPLRLNCDDGKVDGIGL